MYNYITKSIRNTRWAIRNDGGVQKTVSVRPGGVNPNDKTVMINPPGAYMGGLMKTFHRFLSKFSVGFIFRKVLVYSWIIVVDLHNIQKVRQCVLVLDLLSLNFKMIISVVMDASV